MAIDPFEFQRQAAVSDPGTYGWRDQRPAGLQDLAFIKASLQAQGRWTPEMERVINDPQAFQSLTASGGESGVDTVYPPDQTIDLGNALDGYTNAYGRAQDHMKLSGYFDPEGNFVGGEAFDQPGGSLRKGDYAQIASILAAAATAGAGGLSGLGGTLSGGALSGAGASALGGAAVGGTVNGIRTGTLQGALTGAATGGLTGYGGSLLGDAASQYFGGGGPGIDPAAMAGDYTNQMDIASDAFGGGIDAAAQGFDYQNQMDLGNADFAGPPVPQQDLFPPGEADTSRIEVTGQRLPPVPELAPIDYSTPPGMPEIPIPEVPGTGGFDPSRLLDPRIIAPLVTGGLTSLNDPGNPPAPVGTAGNASRDKIISDMEQRLFGPGATGADFSKVPGLVTNAGDPNQYFQQAADALYGRNTRYLDLEQGDKQRALEARLSEQGFVPGTPGYAQAMRVFQDTSNRAYGDARDSAVLSGVTAGQNLFSNNLANANLNNNASQTAFQQAAATRNQPFNEYATLRTGQQIDNQAINQNNQNQYNARVDSTNATNQTIGNVVGGLVNTYTNPLAPTPPPVRKP